MVVHAVYENGVFRPTQPIELPENSQVDLVIQKLPGDSSTTAPLAKIAAIAAAFRENQDLPTDLAQQHDHYLYGTPKKP